MRSPADMKVIQIEVTNACTHSCSNCTRFCGHHKRPFFMDFSTFQQAVDSLRGYDGIIGLMGGEPLLHPDFERMTLYLRECHATEIPVPIAYQPTRDFIQATLARQSANMVMTRCKGPGLWTSMPRQYADHFELIQDSFVFQNLNDHCNPSYHQPLLIARRDLGVPDEEWIKLRDACWIQNCWSASITPKGAFFCEVAAALDMLFDGPGGWPIEPDWWRRTPEDFADQLHWCELCGAALDTTRRDANDEIDDVSPTLKKRLQQLDSPRSRAKRVALYPPSANRMGTDRPKGMTDSREKPEWSDLKPNQYIPKPSQRLGATNTNLLPKAINAIVLTHSGHPFPDLTTTLTSALSELDQVTVLQCHPWVDSDRGQPQSKLSRSFLIQLMENLGSLDRATSSKLQNAHPAERLHVIHAEGSQTLGIALARALDTLPDQGWLLLLVPGQSLSEGTGEMLRTTFLNPGVLHRIPLAWAGSPPRLPVERSGMLIHPKAQALQQTRFNRLADCVNLDQLQSLWPRHKQVAGPLRDSDSALQIEQEYYVRAVDNHILRSTDRHDRAFRQRFAQILSEAAPEKGPVLITQSAPISLTRPLVALLCCFGYQPHVLTQSRFMPFFQELVPEKHIWAFDHCDAISFDDLTQLRQQMASTVKFCGAVMPCAIARDLLEPRDGYQDVKKTALDLADRIICQINLKRQFIRAA